MNHFHIAQCNSKSSASETLLHKKVACRANIKYIQPYLLFYWISIKGFYAYYAYTYLSGVKSPLGFEDNERKT